jgi:hypothetical protein
MNLNDLLNKTMNHTVNVESGAGEEVDYIHESISFHVVDDDGNYIVDDSGKYISEKTITTLKCFPQSGSYKHLNEERMKDAMSFMTLFLDIPPEKNDMILYNGITWRVELIEGTNPYDIVAYRKVKTITLKPNR